MANLFERQDILDAVNEANYKLWRSLVQKFEQVQLSVDRTEIRDRELKNRVDLLGKRCLDLYRVQSAMAVVLLVGIVLWVWLWQQ